MKTAIYIKSYPKDFQWLTYCLRSIYKFASGFSEIVVEIPTGTHLPLTAEKIIHSPEYGNGYLLQQSRKMHADLHADADFILFMDSDAAFTVPVTPESFKTDDKVHWMYTPRAQLEAAVPWFPVMEKFLGRRPKFEFMRRLPQCVPRHLLREIRAFCQSRHGQALESYIMSSAMFSEFNVMGFFMHEFHRDQAIWLNTDDGMSPATLVQHWSYGGLTPEIRKTLDGILYTGADK